MPQAKEEETEKLVVVQSLTERLTFIQTELKAPKNQYNSFGKYSYRSTEDILEGVKPLLVKYQAALILSDEVVMLGLRYYVKATATLGDTLSDDSIVITAYAREEEDKKGMDGSQITGASSSYARKYALNGLFLVDDNKDSDHTNDHAKTPAPKTEGYEPSRDIHEDIHKEYDLTRPQSEKQGAFLKDMLGKKGAHTIGDAKKIIGLVPGVRIVPPAELSSDEAKAVLDFLITTPSEQIKLLTEDSLE